MPSKIELKPKNIDKIKSTLLRPATTSHFEVRIGIPRNTRTSGLGSHLRGFLSGNSQENLNLMCCEAVLPGSQLATTEITNNYTGVTERHAYRRIYDETIDLSFYVDAGNYLPIRFFEEWISGIVNENQQEAESGDYNYRVKYPDDYMATGLKVVKFEKTGNSAIPFVPSSGNMAYSGGQLEYSFIRSYPRSITSMPVSYDGSSLLKCSVQMTYLRYVVQYYPSGGGSIFNPFQQSQFNVGGFLSNAAANLVDSAVDRVTGNDLLGDIAGGLAGRTVRNLF